MFSFLREFSPKANAKRMDRKGGADAVAKQAFYSIQKKNENKSDENGLFKLAMKASHVIQNNFIVFVVGIGFFGVQTHSFEVAAYLHELLHAFQQ